MCCSLLLAPLLLLLLLKLSLAGAPAPMVAWLHAPMVVLTWPPWALLLHSTAPLCGRLVHMLRLCCSWSASRLRKSRAIPWRALLPMLGLWLLTKGRLPLTCIMCLALPALAWQLLRADSWGHGQPMPCALMVPLIC